MRPSHLPHTPLHCAADNQFMMVMSRPRFDAKPMGPANPARDDFLANVSKAEARDEAKAYIAHQRGQREQIFTGTAGQPVGGRMHRQFKLNSQRRNDEWSAEDEAAFQKAFGKSSERSPRARLQPTGY